MGEVLARGGMTESGTRGQGATVPQGRKGLRDKYLYGSHPASFKRGRLLALRKESVREKEGIFALRDLQDAAKSLEENGQKKLRWGYLDWRPRALPEAAVVEKIRYLNIGKGRNGLERPEN